MTLSGDPLHRPARSPAGRGRLQWTLQRLRAMSAREVGFRLARKIRTGAERAGLGLASPGTPHGVCGKPWVSPLPRDFDPIPYVRAADRILEGRFDVFALRGAPLGFPPRWNRDPKSGIEAPLGFGKSIDYRDAKRVGDIKYLWEINRHLELVTLAQAWHLTREPRFAHGARRLLDSWIEQCPYPLGVNWCASLEHGIRLVNWAFAWVLLGAETARIAQASQAAPAARTPQTAEGAESAGAAPIFAGAEGNAFRRRWLESIYRHCHFIDGHWSRHSSANNHLLGEATGLFIASLLWPLWPESERWARTARAELEREAPEQNFEDGVNKEQAIWYHHAVADMLLVAGLFARANGCDFGERYWGALEAMLEFLASIMDVGGGVPAVGDADEGVLVRLSPSLERDGVYRSLLASGAVLFGRPEFRAKAGTLDAKTRWLLGDEAAARFERIDASDAKLPVRRAFPEGGYYILGEQLETEREVRVIADAGPLGYLSIAAHGHADALAFTLSVGGAPLLIDPGTFAYHTEGFWRRYFRGTSAHNTLRVDGEDQSVGAGHFLWLRHARAEVEDFKCLEPLQRLVAWHDGYRRLRDPVRHRRTLTYDATCATLTVLDELQCADFHEVEIFWHFAPECRVAVRPDGRVEASRPGARLELEGPAGLALDLERGSEDGARGPLGWVSGGFDLRGATTTAVFSGRVGANGRLCSRLRILRQG
jgi:hypothetical protein